ncbi:hypothetical protein B0A55_05682 [Friedmanniomyces simplex]|uniref:Uncharacterized protein n=1 Tax=Friedmanniomyces simplex TaxID=329884 RepID=A0A4U0XFA2_9PEZI|nr:hypothetical protein B0A55_05682 [Friedmanniomyces simplex]
MTHVEQYRPPGRSARSGRSHADNDVFEGLPVKQWGQQPARISLAPPASETEANTNDKWSDPPMPRDYQLLPPWTQQLLRLARSGKVGTKRKPDPDSADEDRPDEEAPEEPKANLEDRGYLAKKWKPVPETLLEPEHKHFEFLAKRRRGLPTLYGHEVADGSVVPMRKTKVQKAGPEGEINVYEVLVPEGQNLEGEVTESTELGGVKPVVAAPGTVIEGVGIANEDGVVVAEHLKPAISSRRNRPPPKKKGGPGRGKKRVTFTNPDGSTYTKIVPNATKIVPAPGQTIKHVSKGEEAAADVTAEQAAATTTDPDQPQAEGEGDDDGEEGEDDGEDGDDDDDREEGELSDDDAPDTAAVTPAPPAQDGVNTEASSRKQTPAPPTPVSKARSVGERDASSSPEQPLMKMSHSRQNSTAVAAAAPDPAAVLPQISEGAEDADLDGEADGEKFEDGDEDLLGNLEKHLEGGGEAE